MLFISIFRNIKYDGTCNCRIPSRPEVIYTSLTKPFTLVGARRTIFFYWRSWMYVTLFLHHIGSFEYFLILFLLVLSGSSMDVFKQPRNSLSFNLIIPRVLCPWRWFFCRRRSDVIRWPWVLQSLTSGLLLVLAVFYKVPPRRLELWFKSEPSEHFPCFTFYHLTFKN